MNALGGIFLTMSAGLVAACGSHQGEAGALAPVYYGAAPASSARIYNSPPQIAHSSPSAYGVQPAAYPSRGVQTGAPAPLTPVSQSSGDGRAFDYYAKPVYVAQSQPDYDDQPRGAEELPGQVTVLPGDTVYAISRRTGASPQSIIALNRLDAPYTLRVGQTMRVPSSAVPPSGGARTMTVRGEAINASTAKAVRRDGVHIIRLGDTLYSISRSTGVNVDKIARANGLRAPYTLSAGQSLRIPDAVISNEAPAQQREASKNGDVADIARHVSYTTPARTSDFFDWPIKGAIIGTYGLSPAGKRNDGVNIAAPVGTPVRAAADGDVVYRGSELEGYGNLLLIKHEDGYVTAYAHNDAMLVKKGERVRQGQVIAKVGQSGSAREPQLHFEIRQNLKAVDPVLLLGSL